MRTHPALAALPANSLHALYLDTTYLDPQYKFPTQAAVVRHVVETCRLLQPSRRTLVLFGSYSIGKERVFLQVIAAHTPPMTTTRPLLHAASVACFQTVTTLT